MTPTFDARNLTCRITALAPKSEGEDTDKHSLMEVQMRALMHRSRLATFPFVSHIEAWNPHGRTLGAGVIVKMPAHLGWSEMLLALRDEGDKGDEDMDIEDHIAIRCEASIGKFSFEPYDDRAWLVRWTARWVATPGDVVWLYDRLNHDVVVTIQAKQLALDLVDTPDKTTGRRTVLAWPQALNPA